MAILGLDAGNADVKFSYRVKGAGIQAQHFRHLVAPLDESQWETVTGRRGTPPAGYAMINGQPFAFGDAARRHIIQDAPRGAARYTQAYYGSIAAYACALAFSKATSVEVYATHAPQDVAYVPRIIEAIEGHWNVLWAGGQRSFDIFAGVTIDEPLAGYLHFAYTDEGLQRRRNALRDLTILIVDVGGYTVDVAAVDAGGAIDPLSLASTRTGFLNVMRRFEKRLRNTYSDLFRETGDLDVRRVEQALQSGSYAFGEHRLDCAHIAQTEITRLTNDVRDVINANGGLANYDKIVMTGGGSIVVRPYLQDVLPMGTFVLAEPDDRLASNIRYANATGALKLQRVLRLNGE